MFSSHDATNACPDFDGFGCSATSS